jgi:anti-sigma B factor antagonist
MTLARDGVGEARGVAVIYLEGDLDMQAEERVVAEIEATLAGPQRDVVVDLSAVPFLDSSGVRALLRGREAAQRHGVRLCVRNPRRIVEEVLRITGVAALFGLPGPR